MSVMTESQTDATVIRPFTFEAPEADLEDLRARIAATRWPAREPVEDQTQGVQLATIQALAQYWESDYDWRKCEARLSAVPQFVTEIDGLDIHFIHVRSQNEDALPLIVTHGWPGFGFSGKPTTTGWDPSRIAEAWTVLMKRLGYTRFVAQGGDWGAMVADVMGTLAPPELAGIHVTWPFTVPPEIDQAVQTGSPLPTDLTADERQACEQLAFFYGHDLGYAQEMSHRPQTIYALEDSPVGLAAWLIDHDTRSYAMIARVFDGQPEGLTRDDLLDNITLYWLTKTAVSSARIYWENQKFTFFAPKNVTIPVGVSAFPDEVVQTPRSWTERAYPNLVYYNRPDKGGHFASWEQPQLFAEEVRAAFRQIR